MLKVSQVLAEGAGGDASDIAMDDKDELRDSGTEEPTMEYSSMDEATTAQYTKMKHKVRVCPVCYQVFMGEDELVVHQEESGHNNRQVYSCHICDREFRSYSLLKNHIRTHSAAGEVTCDVCDRTFKNSTLLQIHYGLHTGEKKFECQFCGLGFKSKEILNSHMKVHIQKGEHRCSICGKGFNKVSKLKQHMLTHKHSRVAGMHSCDICHKDFTVKSSLKYHMKHIHNILDPDEYVGQHGGTNDSKYGVGPDGEGTLIGDEDHEMRPLRSNISTLTRLAMSKAGSRGSRGHAAQFLCCELCDMYFSDDTTLQLHTRKAHTRIVYSCDDCAQEFGEANMFENHLVEFHRSEQSYQCQFCDSRFASVPGINAHIAGSHLQRPYICRCCDTRFGVKEVMVDHIMNLTFKSYTCALCNQDFFQECLFKKHTMKHKRGTQYTCDECGSGFSDFNELVVHSKTHSLKSLYPF